MIFGFDDTLFRGLLEDLIDTVKQINRVKETLTPLELDLKTKKDRIKDFMQSAGKKEVEYSDIDVKTLLINRESQKTFDVELFIDEMKLDKSNLSMYQKAVIVTDYDGFLKSLGYDEKKLAKDSKYKKYFKVGKQSSYIKITQKGKELL